MAIKVVIGGQKKKSEAQVDNTPAWAKRHNLKTPKPTPKWVKGFVHVVGWLRLFVPAIGLYLFAVHVQWGGGTRPNLPQVGLDMVRNPIANKVGQTPANVVLMGLAILFGVLALMGIAKGGRHLWEAIKLEFFGTQRRRLLTYIALISIITFVLVYFDLVPLDLIESRLKYYGIDVNL